MRVSVEGARNLGIIFAMSFMLIGFVAGFFRLIKDNSSFDVTVLTPLYSLHSYFMVFGFLGGLLITERIVGSSGIPRAYGTSFSVTMLLSAIAGLLLLTFGWLTENQYVSGAGGILFALGSILFTAMLLRLGGIAHDYSSYGIMATGTISLTIASIVGGFMLPVDNYPLILQMLLFPVIFVLGERVELSKFQFFKWKQLVNRVVQSLLAVTVALTFISAALWNSAISHSLPFLTAALGCLLAASAITFAIERGRKLSRAKTILQYYVDKGIMVAYFWLFLGLLLFLLRINGMTGLYDGAIHSIALGFVVTFIFAHGPVIFPTVMGRNVNINRLSFRPLLSLTISNCLRVFGDMFKLPLAIPVIWTQTASLLVSLSGIILGISVVQFAFMMKKIVRAGG